MLRLGVVKVDGVVVGGTLLLDDQVQVVPQLVTQLSTGNICVNNNRISITVILLKWFEVFYTLRICEN